jgi:hypothetical protein
MPDRRRTLAPLLAFAALAACRSAAPAPPAVDSLAVMDDIAHRYVDLVLELGVHDEGYVDAYYGPPERRQVAEAGPRPVPEIRGAAEALAARLESLALPAGGADAELQALRRTFLALQLRAVATRAAMLAGERFSFDEESRLLYDAVAPRHGEADFAATLAAIDRALPGGGPLVDRFAAWRDGFVIPPERLDAVFTTAIGACRERTREHLELPPDEGFRVEYVAGRPWSAYNWYQGGYQSLIQVNTELPIHVDRAIDLACHEGYPGHHVFNALLEKHLVRDRGWEEMSVYPLYSPQSLLAEGTANYGIEVAFPGGERVAFERDTLFPLAGLDPARADEYYRVLGLVEKLDYAGNEAARRYLEGAIDRDGAVEWLTRYALMPADRAAQRVRFFDAYRAYVINYNLGRDLVAAWVEARGGTAADPERRWRVFAELLTTPRVPSGLEVP